MFYRRALLRCFPQVPFKRYFIKRPCYAIILWKHLVPMKTSSINVSSCLICQEQVNILVKHNPSRFKILFLWLLMKITKLCCMGSLTPTIYFWWKIQTSIDNLLCSTMFRVRLILGHCSAALAHKFHYG